MEIYHTKPGFVLRERDFTVYAVADASSDAIDINWCAGDFDDTQRMQRDDTFMTDGAEYALFSAIIPATALRDANTLKYSFSDRGQKSGEYEVAVTGAGRLPPLMVTELFLRPKGLGVTSYIEVANPTCQPVDLYEYKLLVYDGMDTTAPARSVIYLAEEPGREIINPGKLAVLWLQYPKNHNLRGQIRPTRAFARPLWPTILTRI